MSISAKEPIADEDASVQYAALHRRYVEARNTHHIVDKEAEAGELYKPNEGDANGASSSSSPGRRVDAEGNIVHDEEANANRRVPAVP